MHMELEPCRGDEGIVEKPAKIFLPHLLQKLECSVLFSPRLYFFFFFFTKPSHRLVGGKYVILLQTPSTLHLNPVLSSLRLVDPSSKVHM